MQKKNSFLLRFGIMKKYMQTFLSFFLFFSFFACLKMNSTDSEIALKDAVISLGETFHKTNYIRR